MSAVRPPWQEGHFVGGHLVLDLTNTVFSRAQPVDEGELLKTSSDVLTWCVSSGLFDEIPVVPTNGLVQDVQTVREQAWAVLDAVACGAAPPPEPLGALLERAGAGVRTGHVHVDGTADWALPGAIPSALALMAVQALFTLPRDRLRACGRCGWLFLDSSRGGRRRWCSMSTCGNREKASRHRVAG
ncbi:hypothetical protein ALI144C_24880 [Actinosynnema sp. ALI-1.44]|nr:hypothetical protein ALI144C_24880 [Actinosynnema sp. ALI-1.44]